MPVFDDHQNILGAAGASGAGYTIDQSIRINREDSAYLTRTPTSTGDQKKWTTSFWFKRHKTGLLSYLMTAGQTGTNNGVCAVYINTDDQIYTYFDTTGPNPAGSVNPRKLRDLSAWYHLIWAVDAVNTTQRIWLNGEELSLTPSLNPPNFAYDMNASGSGKRMSFAISAWGHTTNFGNVYAAELHHLDGQYITDPTTFGEYDDNGVWRPIEVTGLTYGTNGFYITGEDSADLGADYSGNGNDFTSAGLTSADQVTDTPTDNFCTWNVLDKGNITTADGNLNTTSGTNQAGIRGTIAIPQSGKYYWEITCNTLGYINQIGLASSSKTITNINDAGATISNRGWSFGSWFATFNSGVTKYNSDDAASSGTNWTGVGNPAATDVLMVAYDSDNGSLWFGKNGTWFDSSGTADPATNTDPRFSGLNDGTEWFPLWAGYSSGSPNYTANFGQLGFTYTPPTGFVALSTANLPEPTIKDGSAYFQTTLYTGNGTAIGSGGNVVSQSGNNSTFQPDFVWIKSRSAATDHAVYDAVRGTTKELITNAVDPEGTLTEGLSTFGTSGFTLGNDAAVNTNAATYAAWQWKEGATQGFDIVTYTGDGSATNRAIAHSLGVAPKMVIVKSRNNTRGWFVWHDSYSLSVYFQFLHSNAAIQTGGSLVSPFGSGNMTASQIVVKDNPSYSANANAETYVAYCFAEIDGFSKFYSYTGNGSADGTFVWCGFRPAFVLIKRFNVGATGNWTIFDNQREGYNVDNDELVVQTTAAETTTDYLDILSNGFKLRSTDADINASSSTYIFMAFAEHPFGGSGIAPVTAR